MTAQALVVCGASGARSVKRMLQEERPWWDALRKSEHKAWLELFLRCEEFKRWYDNDDHLRRAQDRKLEEP